MRLPFPCMKCFKEGGSPFDLSWREFTDSGVYEVTCRNGHDTTFILQEQKFEILFDIGAYAIQDGYYREAISSFTSSLERFYEFSIQVLLFKKDFNYEAFCDTWKLVSNQSERQLGAFVFLYFQRFNQKPQLLSDSNVKLRNQVVHKGKIPTKSEAISYGQSVLDVVRPLLAILKRDFSDAIIEVVFNHIIESRNKVKGDHHYSGINISTIISLTNGEPSHDSKTLEEAIASLVPYFRGEL
jgi:hypothetical protein